MKPNPQRYSPDRHQNPPVRNTEDEGSSVIGAQIGGNIPHEDVQDVAADVPHSTFSRSGGKTSGKQVEHAFRSVAGHAQSPVWEDR